MEIVLYNFVYKKSNNCAFVCVKLTNCNIKKMDVNSNDNNFLAVSQSHNVFLKSNIYQIQCEGDTSEISIEVPPNEICLYERNNSTSVIQENNIKDISNNLDTYIINSCQKRSGSCIMP